MQFFVFFFQKKTTVDRYFKQTAKFHKDSSQTNGAVGTPLYKPYTYAPPRPKGMGFCAVLVWERV